MDQSIDFGKDAANPSGAPEAGGATSVGSRFGGDSMMAMLLRMLARVARNVEAVCYRRLRDMEMAANRHGAYHPGAPNRVRKARPVSPGDEVRIH